MGRPIGSGVIPLEERFWSKVKRDPVGCWEWQAARFSNGYGSAYVSGRGKTMLKGLAHRIAYSIANGPIPSDMLVCHSCDNKACVRPSHLWIGTDHDNTQDMLKKGRNTPPRGERSGKTKFKNEDVIRIRYLAESGVKWHYIASEYSIRRETVRKIVNRERWAHI